MGCTESSHRAHEVGYNSIVDNATLSNFDTRSRYSRRPLEEDFIIEKETVLGEGLNGAVRKARSRTSGKECAVKVLMKKGLPAKLLSNLHEEVNNYLKLDHPHIARLLHVYEDEERACLVMEICSGRELFDRLIEKKQFSEREAKHAVYQMLLAVAYLHKHNVVHCDLKLENFLYESCDKDANLKLIDFGFSMTWLTQLPMTRKQGTIYYSAPEVLKGCYTEKCDIWSLGVVLFTMLAGHPPFPMKLSAEEAIDRITRGDYKFKPERWSDVSEQAQDFVRQCLTVNPDERMSADKCLSHPWLGECDLERMSGSSCSEPPSPTHLLEDLRRYTESSEMRRAALTMIAHHLKSPALAEIKELFLNIDTDHTGTITRDNFRDVLRRGNVVALSDKELSQIFNCIDVAHDGEIHYSEFVAAMLQTRVDMTKDIVRECFDLFDVSRTGTISSSDLHRVLGAKGFEEANIETLLSQGHIDGTKRDITFEEFDDLLRDTSGCPKRKNSKEQGLAKKVSVSLFSRVRSPSNVSDERTRSPKAVNGGVSSLAGAAA